MSSLLNRNYYTIAHDLNPSEEKQERQTIDDSAIAYTADEPSFLNKVKFRKSRKIKFSIKLKKLFKGGGKLEVTVGNPEKQQTPMESYITYEIRTETDRVEYSIQQAGVLNLLVLNN